MGTGKGAPNRWLVILLFALVTAPALPVLAQEDTAAPAEPVTVTLPPEEEPPDPRYKEREVDFMWLADGAVWTDTYRFRVYPRHPAPGETARVRLRLRRTKNGRGRAEPELMKAELRVRRTAGGAVKTQILEEPDASMAFEHTFERTGKHVLSVVVYYSEEETFTVTIGIEVKKET